MAAIDPSQLTQRRPPLFALVHGEQQSVDDYYVCVNGGWACCFGIGTRWVPFLTVGIKFTQTEWPPWAYMDISLLVLGRRVVVPAWVMRWLDSGWIEYTVTSEEWRPDGAD